MSTGGELLVNVLEENGVKYLFGLPGTTEVALLAALGDSSKKIKYILSLHEAVAVGMANGYARGMGQVAWVNVHTSVGTFNSLGGLYSAWRDRLPVILIAGNKDSRILAHDAFCVVPALPEIARQFTKWSWECKSAEQMAEDLARAFRIATADPPGPVFISIPEDFLAEEVESFLVAFPKPAKARSRPQLEQVEILVQMLRGARAPLLMAGTEVATSGAMDLLRELGSLLCIPVVEEPRISRIYLNYPQDDALYLGEYDPTLPPVRECDLLFAIGGQVFLEFGYRLQPLLPRGIKLVQMHPYPEEINKHYHSELSIVCDIALGLKEIIDYIKALGMQPTPLAKERLLLWQKWYKNFLEQRQKKAQELWEAQPISGPRLFSELARVMGKDDIFVDEAITCSDRFLSYFQFTRPGSYHHSSAGALGWGVPAALGLQLAQPSRRVVAVVGDGSCLFSLQAFWTAAHYHLPVKVVVCNNASYYAVERALRNFWGIRNVAKGFDYNLGVSLNDPFIDLVKAAQAFGIEAFSVNKPSELTSVLEYALEIEGPALVNVHIAR